jgi:hypothetical protein
MSTAQVAPAPTQRESFSLSEQQLAFFHTFGYLKVPGLFASDIDEITEAFESVFSAKELVQFLARWWCGKPIDTGQPTGDINVDPPWFETNFDLHFGRDRVTIPNITLRHERLAALERDPRVVDTMASILGPDFETKAADANLFYCDTSWHADMYSSPMNEFHAKLSLYLDPLRGDSGAIRVIPGTNFHTTPFARQLRQKLSTPTTIEDNFGVAPHDVPSWTVTSEPGDAVLWNYKLIHASFNGGDRRRLLSLNFRQRPAEEGSNTGPTAPGGS